MKDTTQFLQELEKVTCPEESYLFSLDVVDLYNSLRMDLILDGLDGAINKHRSSGTSAWSSDFIV